MRNPLKLVIIRHGQSAWNVENRFTGWCDVDLTKIGEQEAIECGKELKAKGYKFDVVHTSLLKRTVKTFNFIAD
jgi:2,3-bisphosphoglycerate-dependent phosphoglycerate mutase